MIERLYNLRVKCRPYTIPIGGTPPAMADRGGADPGDGGGPARGERPQVPGVDLRRPAPRHPGGDAPDRRGDRRTDQDPRLAEACAVQGLTRPHSFALVTGSGQVAGLPTPPEGVRVSPGEDLNRRLFRAWSRAKKQTQEDHDRRTDGDGRDRLQVAIVR